LAKRTLAALAVSLAVALIVVVYVVWRDADRRDSEFTIVSGPPDPVVPSVLPKTPTVFQLRPTSVGGRGRVLVQVGTYLETPRDTITFVVRGTGNARIARCVFPPSGYRDNDQLTCPVPDLAAVRSLLVTRTGNAKVALSANEDTVGYLVRAEQRSWLGRVSTALSRIATALPNGIGSTITVLALFGSVALTLLALLVAPWPARTERSGPEAPPGDPDEG
jgi:hypothetical protein